MGQVRTQQGLTLALMAGLLVLVLTGLGWLAWCSSSSRLLPPHAGATWIVYPTPPDIRVVVQPTEQVAVFDRTFNLATVPSSARLQWCAFRHCTIQLNDRPIEAPATSRWNQVQTADISSFRSGPNTLRIIVGNEVGPPALWLKLDGPDWSVATDERWTVSLGGATECAAWPANRPLPLRPGNLDAGAPRTLPALLACWPWLALFAGLIAGGWAAGWVLSRWTGRRLLSERGADPLTVGLVLAMLLWVVLFAQNTFGGRCIFGFDLHAHLTYIRYVQEHHALPWADQGWEMHHPPLYYVLSATILSLGHLSPLEPTGLIVLRGLGLVLGLIELALVAGCLRLLFPGQPRRQLVGLALATFLPAQLAVYHYISNESLLITLGIAALYLTLRILRLERPSLGWHALLGLCLAAALLTKVTALVVVGCVLLVLAGRLVARGEWRAAVWLRSVGVTLAVMLLASGWYYGRVWTHFGTPLVTNYDLHARFPWWMHPGYGTPEYFLSFGRALADPFFSSLYSLPDGLYATFWGDGLCGGVAEWSSRPPWNYDLMAAGYLLALLPTLLISAGLIAAVVQLVRQPRAEWFLLLGVLAGLALATLYLAICYPYCGHAKAIYELTALLTVCTLIGLGFDLLARLGKVPAVLVTVLLGTWACTAYASFWIRADGAVAQNWAGLQSLALGPRHYAAAEAHFRKALADDPHSVAARVNWTKLLLEALTHARRAGDTETIPALDRAARELTADALREDPNNADALTVHALFAKADGHADEAIADLQRASRAEPDNVNVYFTLGNVLLEQGELAEAETAYREALRVLPDHASAHANLGLVLNRRGKPAEAIAHFRQALVLQPDDAAWKTDLGWLLATTSQPSAEVRAEGLRLAREACGATAARDPLALRSLAAAQAAGGQYSDALATARQAAHLASESARDDLRTALEQQARSYEKGVPFTSKQLFRDKAYAWVTAKQVNE